MAGRRPARDGRLRRLLRPTGLTRLAPPLVALTLAAGAQAACGADPEPSPVAAVAVSPSTPPLTAGAAPSKPHLGLPSGLFATPAPPPDPSHHPAGSPYPARAHGYDASYPQCSAGHPPPGQRFAVLGVNHGKTFTANPCLARQWQLAGPQPGLYLNSGFSAGNAGRTAADCGLLGKQLAAADGYRRAYAIGCTTWEVVHNVVLPYTKVGVIGGIMLGLGRALGETMAVTFIIGNAYRISSSLYEPGNSIASALANEFNEAADPVHRASLITLGLVLFVLTLIVLGLSRLLISQLAKGEGRRT